MVAKRIFSLRLSEDIREALISSADTQSTTVTALINRYIREGLAKDSGLFTAASDPAHHTIRSENSTISISERRRIEELLFQILQNQRQLITNTEKTQSSLSGPRDKAASASAF